MEFIVLLSALVTGLLGSALFRMWWTRGGVNGYFHTGSTSFSLPLIRGHAALAVLGLCAWLFHIAVGANDVAGSIAAGLFGATALTGLTLFRRWLHDRRTPHGNRAEQHFPPALVAAHGLLAGATVILVVIAMW